jgi:hypothetical protein
MLMPDRYKGLLLLCAAIACAGNDTRRTDQSADSRKAHAADSFTPSANRIEPEPNRAMLRALKAYAPGFQRFAASEYAQRVDTTYRADGDFNGDGLPDLALYGHDSTRELLFVLLSRPDSNYRVIPIEDRKLEPFKNGVYVYLRTEQPGPLDIPAEFKRTIEPKPPERLRYAAIGVLYGNEAGELYYWNGKQFVKILTGD